jgi:hypothetical protein
MRSKLVGFGLALLLSAVSALWASPAQASVTTWAKVCGGTEYRYCSWINYDSTNSRVRGYASVEWFSGPWEVAVQHVRLQSSPSSYGGPWTLVSENDDFDGYDGWKDSASTDLGPCHSVYFSVEAKWQVHNVSTGATVTGWFYSDLFWC